MRFAAKRVSVAAGLTQPSPFSVAQGFPSLLGTCEPCTGEYPPQKKTPREASPLLLLLLLCSARGTAVGYAALTVPGRLGMNWGCRSDLSLSPTLWHDICSSKGVCTRSSFWGSPGVVRSTSRWGRDAPRAAAWPGRSFPVSLPLVFMVPIKPKCALQFSFVYYKL